MKVKSVETSVCLLEIISDLTEMTKSGQVTGAGIMSLAHAIPFVDAYCKTGGAYEDMLVAMAYSEDTVLMVAEFVLNRLNKIREETDNNA